MELCTYNIKIKGTVQGVGFRPFVYRLALEHDLAGFVFNHSQGVTIEVEGLPANLNRFLAQLQQKPPPLAVIEQVERFPLPPRGERAFAIVPSTEAAEHFTLISPDIATCEDCRRELFDPADRRYRYPFINCTNCGPRLTIIRDVPYDRAQTTMDVFPMCPDCQREYEDPTDRRFHAQPNACPVCGPQVWLLERRPGTGKRAWGSDFQSPFLRQLCRLTAGQWSAVEGTDPIRETARLLQEGAIVAIKGLGGYHLACDATNEQAVATLRARKYREDKPFALMAPDLATVEQYCVVSETERRLLLSPRRPIVLLRRRPAGQLPPIAPSVAPKQRYLGFFLPYTPLHYLLLAGFGRAMVLTSGNVSDEPIAYEDADAFARLENIADYFLTHNRAIYRRCDDSVTRAFREREMLLRRSRGYAPQPLRLPFATEVQVLAVGAHLKNTFCLTRDGYAILSHHIGDLENEAALRAFEEGIAHFERLFDVHPRIIAHDLHPDYLATQYALKRRVREEGRGTGGTGNSVPVQHHHAHIAACLADNGCCEQVLGVSFDGVGLGPDGTIWGGEFLVADYGSYERVGHLAYVPMPGGERAIKEPWRMAATWLYRLYGADFLNLPLPFVQRLDLAKWRVLRQMLDRNLNCPLTSSVGRLFDAVAALVGVRDAVNYEGQAAIELEMLADESCTEAYRFDLKESEGVTILEPAPVLRAVVADILAGAALEGIAARFHRGLARAIGEVCALLRERRGLNVVALSGGVFQNMFLLESTVRKLEAGGFKVLVHSRVPPNDGGLSLGQAAIAAWVVGERGRCAWESLCG